MDPYRSSEHSEPTAAPVEGGIVADVIAQFADPLAFYRELVQNAIDAGTPSVEVRIERVDASTTRVSVKDRGEGMSRDTIENQLLVLFRSTKEKDDKKIGKFGIGFSSVLAPNPSVVAVHSVRDGRRLTLHLSRDLTYRLFDAGTATQTGTTVELDLAMTDAEVAPFVGRSEAALVKWCRHASVQIDLHVPGSKSRIDRPLALDSALIAAAATHEELTVVVGVTHPAHPYLGFFNHGLMLHETSQSPLGKIAVKIQDSRLGHTLSRDDVRRDAAYDRALEFAQKVAKRELPAAASRAVAELAATDQYAKHAALVDAICAAEIEGVTWTFPAIGGPVELRLGRSCWATVAKGELAREVAAHNNTVLLAHDIHWLRDRVDTIASCRVRWVEEELTRVAPVELDDAGVALHALLVEAIAGSGRAPSKIVFAHLQGACSEYLSIAGLDVDGVYHVDREEAALSPFGRLRRPPMVLGWKHPYVVAARSHPDPRLAATYLARAILLGYQLLDEDRSAKLLELALDRIGVG